VWRYQPRDNDNDTSVTTWAVTAIASAKFFGLEVNPTSLKLAATYYDQVTSPDGRIGYTKRGELSSRKPGDHAKRFPVQHAETLTAAGTFGRLAMGKTLASTPMLELSANVLAAKPASWAKGHVDSIYWFFGAYAAQQLGGECWDVWRRALGTLVEHQRQGGNADGSWDPVGVWDEDGGRVATTALYALALEAVAGADRRLR
jgi:hypothetical protein